jgi:(p)ppGpp synthase/HD superfamily hydrolase
MTAKTVNYTPEQTAVLISRYVDEKVSVEAIAAEFGKSVRSIVAKLSREGVYKAKEYTTKKGDAPVKKDALASELMLLVGLTEAEADSLGKANKTALAKILAIVKAAKISNANDVS